MGEISENCMNWMVDYIYWHFDAFKLILCYAEDTEYERFVHTMAEIEREAPTVLWISSKGWALGQGGRRSIGAYSHQRDIFRFLRSWYIICQLNIQNVMYKNCGSFTWPDGKKTWAVGSYVFTCILAYTNYCLVRRNGFDSGSKPFQGITASWKKGGSHNEKRIQSIKTDGVCGTAQVPDDGFMDVVRGQCTGGVGIFLIYLAYHLGSDEYHAGLFVDGEPDAQRLADGVVRSDGAGNIYRRFPVC